jgi:hypothetical protein
VDNSLLLWNTSEAWEPGRYLRGWAAGFLLLKITQERTMKIKLEITMDNGSIDNSVVDGNPAPESIMELMNKLKSLHDAAVAAQSSNIPARQAPQPAVNTPPQIQPQIQSQTQPLLPPLMQTQTQPLIQPQMQTQTQPLIQPQMQPQTQPLIQPQMQPQIPPQIQPAYAQQYINQPPQHNQQNIGGTRNLQIAEEEYSRLKNESLTIKQRLELFLNFEYKAQWFTSLEVKRDYDRVYGNINLSTVSTYLSRMFREDKLERMGNRNQRKYHIREEPEPQEYSFGAVPSFVLRT